MCYCITLHYIVSDRVISCYSTASYVLHYPPREVCAPARSEIIYIYIYIYIYVGINVIYIYIYICRYQCIIYIYMYIYIYVYIYIYIYTYIHTYYCTICIIHVGNTHMRKLLGWLRPNWLKIA